MDENLHKLLLHIVKFNTNELEKITDCFKPKSIKKGDFLLREGQICKEFYYVEKGCIRTYFIDKTGEEKTRYVMTDFTIGTALTSFATQTPSTEFIDAQQDTQLLIISHADFFRLNKQFDNWKLFYQKILELAYSFQNRRIESLVTLTAKQRYDEIMNNNPLLIQKLSNKVLASFLDIRPETLSRLKSK